MHKTLVRGITRWLRTLGVVGAGLALAVGMLGVFPSLAAASTTTVSFSYTGSAQSWTVPAHIGDISFTITAGGGGGGAAGGGSNGEGGPGGNPATVTGELTQAQAGDVISVIVGGGGAGGQLVSPTSSTVMAGGWGGAGSGGSVSAPDDVGYGQVDFGGGGGGMSAISSASACSSGSGDYCAIAGGGGGGGASSGGGDVTIWGAQGGNAGSAGATSTVNGVDCAYYGVTTSSGIGNGGAAGSAGAAAPGGAFDTGVTDPGPTGTGGGGGGGAAGGSVGNGGVVEDIYGNICVIGGGGGGGGASYIDTTDTTSAVVATASSGGGAAVQVYAGGPGSNGANGEVSFTYTPAAAPEITSASSATFTGGEASSFTFSATGNPAPSFSESGTLPKGVTLATSGVLSGTPEEEGSFPIVVTATNGVNPDATQDFTLTVTLGSLGVAPEISSASSTTFVGGEASSFSVTASGYPTPQISESGTLPKGVSFQGGAGTASISGTPEQDGTFALTLTAANGVSPDATQDFTLEVSAGRLVADTGTGNAAATLSSGVLSFVAPPGNLAFPAVDLDGVDQTTTASLGIGVSDGTGSGAGWALDATSTTFSNGTSQLPPDSVTVDTAPTVGCDTGATCTLATDAVSYPYVLPAGTSPPAATALFSAASGTGMGDQTVTPSFSLAVPANAAAGAYSATWTFSLVAGP